MNQNSDPEKIHTWRSSHTENLRLHSIEQINVFDNVFSLPKSVSKMFEKTLQTLNGTLKKTINSILNTPIMHLNEMKLQ